ncbi:MAG TPA: hypothetical protein PKJ08_10280 [Candidatus Cloacimonadota bacterium]|nr:hypothetical protein [Candidatus Cloacimonadota bacterium]HPM02235.1 hypothetical protein [Candidatus Cloacimonadota bacterium]
MLSKCFIRIAGLLIVFVLISGCAAFRKNLNGQYLPQNYEPNDSKPVKVLFVFSHYHQIKGLDTVQKLSSKYQILKDFNAIFSDARYEIQNLGTYDMFTDDPDDVNSPKRRLLCDSLKHSNDFTIHTRILKSNSFAQYVISSMFSTASLTLIPTPYQNNYEFETRVYNQDQRLIATYKRDSSVVKWVQPLMILLYPFYPFERMQEEVYLLALHDIYKQINQERILTKE